MKKVILIVLLTSFIAFRGLGQFTSVQSGDWNDGATWGNNSPGIQGTDWPSAMDNATIASGHIVTLIQNETINDLTVNTGGVFDFNGFVLTLNGAATPFISQQTGNYNTSATWLNGSVPGTGDNVIVSRGHTVTITGNTTMNDLTINGGGVFNDNNKTTTVNGNLVINGTHTGQKDITVTGGAGVTIDGTGVLNSSKDLVINGDVAILASANFTVISKVQIAANTTVTNNGSVTINDELKGVNSSTSIWTNAAGSSLEVGDKLLNIGTLNASAIDNTVIYSKAGGGVQQIKNPSSSTYYNLTIEGTVDKVLQGNLNIDGDLTITSGTLDVDNAGNYGINLKGNWNVAGTFNEQLGTVTFDGTGSQTVTNASDETFYNLVINKPSGSVTLDNNVIVSNALTMTAGNISTGTNKITVGTGVANEGTLSYISGQVIGKFERWIASSTTASPLVFPVGTTADYRPVLTTFNTITSGGSLIAEFVNTDPGNNGLMLDDAGTSVYNTFVDGYWDLTIANGFSSSDFDLEVTGNGFSAFTIDAATRVLARPDAATAWFTDGTHVAATGNTAKRNNMTTLSCQIAFGDDTNCTGPTTSAITGPVDVCTNALDQSYSVALNAGNTYTWTVTGGSIDSPGSGIDVNSITVDWGATGQAGTVQVVETNSCTSGAPVELTVTINSIAPTSIIGKTSVAESTQDEPYSVTAMTGYTYTWSVDGGVLDAGQNTSSVTVDWGMSGTGNISVVAQKSGCSAATAIDMDVTKYVVINSAQNGNWDDASTWDTGNVPSTTENARILNGHTVILQGAETINNFIIDAGGTLDAADRNQKLTVTGDITVDGTYSGGTKQLILSGANTAIDGTGTINITGHNIEIKTGNKTISSTAVINVAAGDFEIKDANITITNNGSITIMDDLIGRGDGTNTWTNGENTTLTIGGTLLTNGTLNASALGNTVNYSGSLAQAIKIPATSYFNLTLSGAGTKTAPAANLDILGDLTNEATFASNSQTVTFSGSTPQIIGGTSLTDFNNLTINHSGNGVTLAARIDVSGTLNMTNGILASDATNFINIKDGGASNDGNAASYVDGPIKKTGNTAFTFPTGDGTIWAPVGIANLTGGAVTDEFIAEYFHSPAPNPNNLPASGLNRVSKVEYWEVSHPVGIATQADVTFYWKDASVSGIYNLSETGGFSDDLVAVHYNDLTSEWEVLATTICGGSATGVGGTGCITATFTSFSPVGFGSALGPNTLPVELISFTGKLNDEEVILNWVTASEINNDYFEIQRSEEGKDWEVIASTPGNGTSNEIISYQFIDNRPFFGISYYRLRQVDFDGQFEYSPVVNVNNPFKGRRMEASVYPNPNQGDELNFRLITDNKENKVFVKLLDLKGRSYFEKPFKVDELINKKTLCRNLKLKSGIYILVVKQNNYEIKQKLIIY